MRPRANPSGDVPVTVAIQPERAALSNADTRAISQQIWEQALRK